MKTQIEIDEKEEFSKSDSSKKTFGKNEQESGSQKSGGSVETGRENNDEELKRRGLSKGEPESSGGSENTFSISNGYGISNAEGTSNQGFGGLSNQNLNVQIKA